MQKAFFIRVYPSPTPFFLIKLVEFQWSTLVGKRVRKQFGKKLFEGDVIEYDADKNCYKVIFT